jgi:hypothetical protein
MSCQKWTIYLVKQGRFKVGVVPADGLGRLQLKTIISKFIKWGSLAMSDGAKSMNYGRSDCPAYIKASLLIVSS